MKNDLAIVIPAYKPNYLAETLESIARQTCMDFTLYIGDDASPYDLNNVIQHYQDRIAIVYHKFNNNFGAKDLVAQWNRCLDLAEKETWLWLFSDDDRMDPNCVQRFYEFIATRPDPGLLHFNVQIIDGQGKELKTANPFPKSMSNTDFFTRRIKGEINSYVVEYIFKRELYLEKNKFQNFDLAWSADDATWIKFSDKQGIHTIEGALVQWRYSDQNISSMLGNKTILQRKADACISFLQWAEEYFSTRGEIPGVSDFEKFKRTILTMIAFSTLPLGEKFNLSLSSVNKLKYPKIKVVTCAFLLYLHVKKIWFSK